MREVWEKNELASVETRVIRIRIEFANFDDFWSSNALPIGPILLGMSKPIHVVVPSVTARGIVNLSALAVVEAQSLD